MTGGGSGLPALFTVFAGQRPFERSTDVKMRSDPRPLWYIAQAPLSTAGLTRWGRAREAVSSRLTKNTQAASRPPPPPPHLFLLRLSLACTPCSNIAAGSPFSLMAWPATRPGCPCPAFPCLSSPSGKARLARASPDPSRPSATHPWFVDRPHRNLFFRASHGQYSDTYIPYIMTLRLLPLHCLCTPQQGRRSVMVFGLMVYIGCIH